MEVGNPCKSQRSSRELLFKAPARQFEGAAVQLASASLPLSLSLTLVSLVFCLPQAPLLGGGGGRGLLMGNHGKVQGLAVAAVSLVLLALAAQDFSRMHAGVSMLEMEQLADVSVPSSSFPSYYAGVQSLAGGQPSIAGAVGQSLATADGSACGGG